MQRHQERMGVFFWRHTDTRVAEGEKNTLNLVYPQVEGIQSRSRAWKSSFSKEIQGAGGLNRGGFHFHDTYMPSRKRLLMPEKDA